MKNVTLSTEEDQKHNTRKMCQTVNQFKKGYQHKISKIMNKNEEMAMNTKRKSRNMEGIF